MAEPAVFYLFLPETSVLGRGGFQSRPCFFFDSMSWLLSDHDS
jgi:hypothetical protein